MGRNKVPYNYHNHMDRWKECVPWAGLCNSRVAVSCLLICVPWKKSMASAQSRRHNSFELVSRLARTYKLEFKNGHMAEWILDVTHPKASTIHTPGHRRSYLFPLQLLPFYPLYFYEVLSIIKWKPFVEMFECNSSAPNDYPE